MTTFRILAALVAASCAVGMLTPMAAQEPPSRPRSSSQSRRTQTATQTVSPTVMATWMASGADDGARVLQLLVLWRGTPVWFTRGSGSGESGGGDGRRYFSTLRYGGVELQLEYEFQTRIATIQGNRVELRDDNVVLVDGVDEPGGLRVVRTLRVDSTLGEGGIPRVEEVMRRSPDIVSFLQCETRLSDPLQQKFADIVCAKVIGK